VAHAVTLSHKVLVERGCVVAKLKALRMTQSNNMLVDLRVPTNTDNAACAKDRRRKPAQGPAQNGDRSVRTPEGQVTGFIDIGQCATDGGNADGPKDGLRLEERKRSVRL